MNFLLCRVLRLHWWIDRDVDTRDAEQRYQYCAHCFKLRVSP